MAEAPSEQAAAPEPGLFPGGNVSVTETGGTGERGQDPLGFTGVITRDVQPQLQGGNTALEQAFTETLTRTLNQTLAEYADTLGPSIVESLKSPDTAPVGLAALDAHTTPEQKFYVLKNLAPFSTSPDFYAYRDPQVENDVSLINRQAIAEQSQQQLDTRQAAATLKQQGELATADSLNYLADHGVKTTPEALKISDAMRLSMPHIEQSHIVTNRTGNSLVAVMQVPGAPLPMLNAVGPVDDQGVWHPTVNGYAISTPARQQMMEQFNRPEMREHLQQQGVQQIAPTFRSSAEPNVNARPPTQAQTREQTPNWDQIAASPAFQQLPPAQQQVIKQGYFNRRTALTPPVKDAVRQNPALYQPIQEAFVGPQPMTGPPAPATGFGAALRQNIRETNQELLGPIGGAIAGATQGFVPESVTRKVRQFSGRHPVAEWAGGMATDIGAGLVAGPVAGPMALETARAGAEAAWKGLPVLDRAAKLSEIAPVVGAEPTSIGTSMIRSALGQAILWKAAQKALPYVGKALGRAGAIVQNFFKRGAWTGKDLRVLERVAANDNSTFGLYVNDRVLEQMPNIRVNNSKNLRILMKDGTVMDETNFNPQAKTMLQRMQDDPKYRPDFIDIPEMQNVELIEGPAQKMNTFFAAQNMELEVVRADLVKGANVRQVKGKWEVRQGTNIQTFDTQAEAHAHVDTLPALPTRVEDQGLKRLASQMVNGHYLAAQVKNPVPMVGEVSGAPNFIDMIQELGARSLMPPRARFQRIEARGGAPLFSQVYDKVEQAVVKQKLYEIPWRTEINTLLKGIGKNDKRLEGYMQVLDNLPGSTAWDTVVQNYKLDDKVARGIHDWIMRFSADMGLNGINIMHNVIPQIKRFGSVSGAYKSGNIPKEVEYFLEANLTGKLPWAEREGNIRTMLNAMLTEGAFNKHVKGAYENAAQLLEAVKHRPTEAIEVDNYLRQLKGWGEGADSLVYRAVGGMIQRVFKGEIDPITRERIGKEFIGQLFAWNYGAYFAFRPAAVIRQGFQTIQTIYPRFGEIATAAGIMRAGVRANWARLKASGAVEEEPYREDGFVGWGTRGVGWSDKFQRAIAAFSQEYKMEKPMIRYIADQNWARFAKSSGVGLMDEQEQLVLKQLIDSGQSDVAKLRAMKFASDDTNFNYTPQNRPPVLNTFFGRFLGQFGSYPAYYANYIGHMFTRGDTMDKTLWLGRFVAAHAATYEVAKTVFNADMTNFLFLGPVNYTGGAMATKLWHLEQALVGSGRSQADAKRDVQNPAHWAAMAIPGSSAAADWMDAVHTRTGTDFFREFFLAAPKYDKNK